MRGDARSLDKLIYLLIFLSTSASPPTTMPPQQLQFWRDIQSRALALGFLGVRGFFLLGLELCEKMKQARVPSAVNSSS